MKTAFLITFLSGAADGLWLASPEDTGRIEPDFYNDTRELVETTFQQRLELFKQVKRILDGAAKIRETESLPVIHFGFGVDEKNPDAFYNVLFASQGELMTATTQAINNYNRYYATKSGATGSGPRTPAVALPTLSDRPMNHRADTLYVVPRELSAEMATLGLDPAVKAKWLEEKYHSTANAVLKERVSVLKELTRHILTQLGVKPKDRKSEYQSVWAQIHDGLPICKLSEINISMQLFKFEVKMGKSSPSRLMNLALNLKEHLEAMKAKLATLADQDLEDHLTGKLSKLVAEDVKGQLTLKLDELIQSADLLLNIGQYYEHLISVAIAEDH